jgi:RNA polymerase sigma factor (sigma-70 family)
MVGVDIAEHIARHEDSINYIARRYTYNRDDFEDVKQTIALKMIEAHEGGYDHSYTLWTYIQKGLDGIIGETLDQYHHFESDEKGRRITVPVPNADVDEEGIANLEMLQEMGLVDPLYGSPFDGLKTPLEDTLSPEDQALVEKLKANLTDEELDILMALIGPGKHDAWVGHRLDRRTEREAAESLDIPWPTYKRKLDKARAKAESILGISGAEQP